MANGIANNGRSKKKKISTPAEQSDKTNICLSSFAKTPSKGIIGFKGISTRDELKEQIRKGEYKSIKISDRPIQIEQSTETAEPVKKDMEIGD